MAETEWGFWGHDCVVHETVTFEYIWQQYYISKSVEKKQQMKACPVAIVFLSAIVFCSFPGILLTHRKSQ